MSLNLYLSLLDMLESGVFPPPGALASLIENCSPQAVDGPVPPDAPALEARYLKEAETVPPAFSVEPVLPSLSDKDAGYLRNELFHRARQLADAHFGRRIYIRGLIEISNICRQNCRYCGIRRGNVQSRRYRLSPEQILSCCKHGYELGFRTFVLQGGEDSWFTDSRLAELLHDIKKRWPDCAVTLSIGEKDAASYRLLRNAGADRFLLRHETAEPAHYAKLHPSTQSWERRMECLRALKACGYQTGAGFMVGSPWQTTACLVRDLMFLRDFQPEMVGIGPFIPHAQTPFARFPSGNVDRTLVMVALVRLLLPSAMLPSTTALGTAADDGRERGILAGANVLMPNLSPKEARDRYRLYNNKLSEGAECADNLDQLKKRMQAIGYEIVEDRGDFKADSL